MKWTVEYDDAYERWVSRTDFEAGGDIRLAVLGLMVDWKRFGPPPEVEFDSAIDAWSCDVPGTPVEVEYVIWRDIATVFVVDFHS